MPAPYGLDSVSDWPRGSQLQTCSLSPALLPRWYWPPDTAAARAACSQPRRSFRRLREDGHEITTPQRWYDMNVKSYQFKKNPFWGDQSSITQPIFSMIIAILYKTIFIVMRSQTPEGRQSGTWKHAKSPGNPHRHANRVTIGPGVLQPTLTMPRDVDSMPARAWYKTCALRPNWHCSNITMI